MPKITVMSAEKAFLAAHYGGPFDFNKEDYDNIEPELEEVYEWENNKLATVTKNIY